MQPFSWSEAELQQSKTSDHAKTQRRYSLDNENFDFHSLQDLLGALGARGLLTEGAIYYAADFALVEPDCFENVDEFLQSLEMRHLEKFDPTQVYFTSADDVARAALQRAVAAWINEFIYVEHHWCLVGQSQQLAVTRSDIQAIDIQPTPVLMGNSRMPLTSPADTNPVGVRRLKAARQKTTRKFNRPQQHP